MRTEQEVKDKLAELKALYIKCINYYQAYQQAVLTEEQIYMLEWVLGEDIEPPR